MPSDSNSPEQPDEIRDLPPQAPDSEEAEQVKGGIIIVGGRSVPPTLSMPHVQLPAVQQGT